MRSTRIVTFAVSLVLTSSVALAQLGAKSSEQVSPKAGMPIFMPASSLQWTDLNPTGAPGVKIVDVWGDHAKSGYGAFLKFPAGFLSPLHTHTHDIKIVVISGTYTQAPERKETNRMGAGSYVFQPGGSYKHISGCDKASDCVLFIESTGPFDLLPVAGVAK